MGASAWTQDPPQKAKAKAKAKVAEAEVAPWADHNLGTLEPRVNFWWGQGKALNQQPCGPKSCWNHLKPVFHFTQMFNSKPYCGLFWGNLIPKMPWPICHSQSPWEKISGQNGQDLVHARYEFLWGFGWGPLPRTCNEWLAATFN